MMVPASEEDEGWDKVAVIMYGSGISLCLSFCFPTEGVVVSG